MKTDQQRAVQRFLEEAGATDIGIEMGGKHPRIVFAWHGKSQFYVLPGTPSETFRAADNSISDLRHMLGLVAPVKRVGARRVRKHTAPAPLLTLPDRITLPNSHVDRLMTHPAVVGLLPRRADRAWLRFWQAQLSDQGGVSMLTGFGRFTEHHERGDA